jgi:hypothetical protein
MRGEPILRTQDRLIKMRSGLSPIAFFADLPAHVQVGSRGHS